VSKILKGEVLTPELSRLGSLVVNTKLFYEKYSSMKRDFADKVSKAEAYNDLEQNEKDIINDCLKSIGITIEQWHQQYMENGGIIETD
jgi:hypothetical protein